MKLGRYVLSSIVLCLWLVIAGCSSTEVSKENSNMNPTEDNPMEIKISTEAAEGNIRVDQLEKLNEILQEESDGTVGLSIYPGAQLYDDIEAIQEMAAGSFDGAQTLSGSVANLIPELNVIDLPFFFKDDEAYRNFLWNTELGDYYIDEMAKHNLMPIAVWDPGEVLLLLGKKVKEPPKEPEDLKGVVLTDSGSPAWNKSYTALGATATSMPVVESIPGVAQGTIDGIAGGFTNWSSVMPDKKLSPNAINLPMKFTWLVTVNKDWFDSLPEKSQEELLHAGKKSEEWQYDYIDEEDEKAKQELKEQGRQWSTITEKDEEWTKAIVPIYKEYEEKYGTEFMRQAYEASGRDMEFWNELGLGLE